MNSNPELGVKDWRVSATIQGHVVWQQTWRSLTLDEVDAKLKEQADYEEWETVNKEVIHDTGGYRIR